MNTAYDRYFNNKIGLLTFLSENYRIRLNKKIHSENQFIEKILFNKNILKNYLLNNNMKSIKIIIKDISNENYYQAEFILQ
jgi:hypothetical protein